MRNGRPVKAERLKLVRKTCPPPSPSLPSISNSSVIFIVRNNTGCADQYE
jgi:hypothetical protein